MPQAGSPTELSAAPSPVATVPEDSAPLAPLPLGSPRQTFASFKTLSQQGEDALLAAIELASNNNALMDTPEVKALKQQAILALVKAASTLDLSSVAPESRRTVGISSVLLLKEILERLTLPPLAEIPDTLPPASGSAPRGWTLPDTEIRITEQAGPDGKPRFVFSADTIDRLPEFYELVRALPQKTGSPLDFYKSFVLGPGLSVPVEIYHYVLKLPDWMLVDYGEQAVWQWMAFVFLTTILLLLTFLLLRRSQTRPQAPRGTIRRAVQHMISPALLILLLAAYRWVSNDVINLTGSVEATLELMVIVLQALGLATVIVMGFNTLAAVVIALPRIRTKSLDASLIRLVVRAIGIVVACYVLTVAAARIGVPLYGIIASLGVGGLALALAVRPTLENFIGGIILYADRPVQVGDLCKFGDIHGRVESIGLRSTKIRALDRTLVTVQNADFVEMSITNFARRDSNLFSTTIGLSCNTDSAELAEAIDEIGGFLRAHAQVRADTVRVSLRGLWDNTLHLEVWAYVQVADWNRFLAIQQALLLQVIAVLQARGIEFAAPPQGPRHGAGTQTPRQAGAAT